MIAILLNLIILLIIFAVAWLIIQKIPIPPDFSWIVQVILLLVFLVSLLAIFGGGFAFYPHFHT